MALAVIESVAFVGADASLVQVEVDIGQGMPGFRIVGLPNASVREAEQRVRSALLACKERWVNLRKTANLAPGSLRKEGTHFDLSLALGVAAADDGIELKPESLEGWVCIGELALDASVRPVRGVLAAAMDCRESGRRGLVCPLDNAPEAALVEGVEIVGVANLRQAMEFFKGTWEPGPIPAHYVPPAAPVPDLRSVRGHAYAKRALEVAAAGGHNLFL